jgi:hypothetical protein
VTLSLRSLVAEARSLANDHPCISVGCDWQMEGGRHCAREECDGSRSQPVFRCTRCGAHDYGELGGPGARWCATECR